MKQKRTYSLTAKERKAKRMAEQNKRNSKVNAVENSETVTRESAERAMISSQKRSRRSAIVIGAVCLVAIILILVALIAPVILYIINPYRGYKSVIARFNLSNDMVLEFVIEEDKYDTAATNFIFLAKNGFFDNTVFYDAQNGWLRFGGYEAQPSTTLASSNSYDRTHHHKDNVKFCERFAALPNKSFTMATRKFGYRLTPDKGGTESRLLEQEGILAYLYSDTATEFQFTYQEQATNQIVSLEANGTQKTYELNPTMVGHALNSKTIKNIKAIASANPQRNPSITTGYLWTPPTPDIKITSVKVYNLNSSKWRDFDFLKYMKGNNSEGIRRVSQWIDVV
ncbi:MAG: hypothetical protein J1G01_03630 [Clostridiales bacterium]|nr:hypothetical protein [Clostridiales bacterium]